YEFLRDRGLHWGGLPHWSFDPSAPPAGDALWVPAVRDILLRPGGVTVGEYVERLRHIETLLAVARRHVDAQQWRDARPPLEEVLLLTPPNPAALYLLGICLLAEDDPALLKRAVELLSDALDAGFDPAWVSVFRAQAHLRLGNLEAAETDLNVEACRSSE